MRILGLDPGTHNVGYGVVEWQGNRARALAFGTLRPGREATVATRLRAVHADVCALIAEHGPDVVGVESLFAARSHSAALAVGQARGAVLVACAGAGHDPIDCNPSTVKVALTGTGRADKGQVRQMVVRLIVGAAPRNDHEADALAVAYAVAGQAVARARGLATSGRVAR